jgi:hypothetical protein
VLALTAALASGCATAPPSRQAPQAPPILPTRVPGKVEIVYRGEGAFARRGAEEWSLGDVRRDEMCFSPDGQKFAYVRQKSVAAPPHVLVRNVAGDPVNEFPVYRPALPQSLTWLDDRRLGYITPPDPSGKMPAMYVLHDAQTGEVLSARSGSEFVFSPSKKHVAFLSGVRGRQAVVVDGRTVWPRRGVTTCESHPVWSPDGHGLALVERAGAGLRLVVLVDYEDPGGDLTWPIPPDAMDSALKVFWAGDSKVVIGETALRPKFAAGWERLK